MGMFTKDRIDEAIKNVKKLKKTIEVFSLECPVCKKLFEYENYNQAIHTFKSHTQTH